MQQRAKSTVSLFLASLFVAISSTAAEPFLHFPLNEGKTNEIHETSGHAGKIAVWNEKQLEWTDGPSGKALLFNTPDDIRTYAGISFKKPAGIEPEKGFTFCALVKTPPQLHRSRQYQILYWCDSAKGPGFRIHISWKMLMMLMGDGTKTVVISSKNAEGPIQPDTWYHVAATYDGKTAKLFINGAERASGEFALKPSAKNQISIGATTSQGSGYAFNGVITDVKIFRSALTPDEIAVLSNGDE